MLSASVDQKPTFAVTAGTKATQNSPKVWNFEGCDSMGPKPPALLTTQTSSTSAITSTIGAAQFSNTRTAFIPRRMITMLSVQKIMNEMAEGTLSPSSVASPPRVPKAGHTAAANVLMPSPPKYTLMPNHPHATIARKNAGTLAPRVPNDERASTGNETPYFVPGCALSRMGPSTMTFAMPMVSSACHQFIPTSADTRLPARVYVGMQWAMLIHRAAKL